MPSHSGNAVGVAGEKKMRYKALSSSSSSSASSSSSPPPTEESTATGEESDERSPLLNTPASRTMAATSDNTTSPENDFVDRFDGTTKLVVERGIILLPSPSQDPRDPLNLPEWRKAMLTAILVLYGVCGLTLVTALGALLPFIMPEYVGEGITEAQISGLLTYPNLLLGVGNLVSMPLAIALGRRPVLLLSTVLLFVSAVLCATNRGFTSHLAARCLAALSAAQCEALVLLMIQDIYFLHQRARVLQYFSSAQVMLNSSLVISCSYVAAAAGWRSWYWIFVGLSALVAILTFTFVPETSYDRPIESFIGVDPSSLSVGSADTEDARPPMSPASVDSAVKSVVKPITVSGGDHPQTDTRQQSNSGPFATLTTNDERPIDLTRFKPRTWKSDTRIFSIRPNWQGTWRTAQEILTVFWFPNVLWVSAFNGLLLGADISIQITYANTLVAPPYNWAPATVSLIQLGQIAVALISMPLVGWAGDAVIRVMAARKGKHGVHEPEHRLITLSAPVAVAVALTSMYGFVLANPEGFHWFAIAATVDLYLYILLAASTAGTTYLIDAYPKRAGAILVVIPVTRGLVSFGVSKETVNYITNIGPAAVFGIYSACIGAFGLIGCLLFWKGRAVRRFCGRWAV